MKPEFPVLPDIPIQEKNRFAYLDGTRGWAALLVVIHHGVIALDFALYTGNPAESWGAWDLLLSGMPFILLAAGGNLAVCIFFALSGFVLAHAYTRSRQYWPSLVLRRYARLGIPMLAGCLIAWMLLALGLMRNGSAAQLTHSSWLAAQFHQRPSLLQAVFEPITLLLGSTASFSTSYDSSLWTMPLEAEMSLVFIGIFVVLRHLGRYSLQMGGYLFCVLTVLCAGSYFGLFAFGAALRLLQPERLQAWLGGNRLRLAATAVAGLFFGTVPTSPERWAIFSHMASLAHRATSHTWFWPHTTESFWHGIGAALILLALSANGPMQSALSRPISGFLGRISFPLYILHVPLLMVVECNAILLSRQAGVPLLVGGLISLILFSVSAVAVSALLTPLIEGGAITVSARLGEAVDTLIQHRRKPRTTTSIATTQRSCNEPPTA